MVGLDPSGAEDIEEEGVDSSRATELLAGVGMKARKVLLRD